MIKTLATYLCVIPAALSHPCRSLYSCSFRSAAFKAERTALNVEKSGVFLGGLLPANNGWKSLLGVGMWFGLGSAFVLQVIGTEIAHRCGRLQPSAPSTGVISLAVEPTSGSAEARADEEGLITAAVAHLLNARRVTHRGTLKHGRLVVHPGRASRHRR